MNQPFRLRYANLIVGSFTLAVLVGFIVLTAFIFRRGQYFDEPQLFYLEVSQDDASDLYEGAEVWMLGQRAGSVSSLRYVGDTDIVRIELAIKSSLADQVTDDAEIRLERKFGVGTPQLRIRRPDRTEGSLLPSTPSSKPSSAPSDTTLGDPATESADEPPTETGASLGTPRATRGQRTAPQVQRPANQVQRQAATNNLSGVHLSNPWSHPWSTAFRGGLTPSNASRTVVFRPQQDSSGDRPARRLGGGLVKDDAADLVATDPDAADSPADAVPPARRLRNFVGENDRLNQISAQVSRVADSVEAIRQKTVPTLEKVGQSSEDISTTMNGLDESQQTLTPRAEQTLDEIQRTAKSLRKDVDELTGEIEALVQTDVRDAVTAVRQSADATRDASARAEDAAARAAAAADAVAQTSTATGEEIETTLRDLRTTSAAIRRLTSETLGVVRIVRDEAEDLPGTTDRFNDAVGETQDLVEQIQSHWLLRKTRQPDEANRRISPSSIRVGGGH